MLCCWMRLSLNLPRRGRGAFWFRPGNFVETVVFVTASFPQNVNVVIDIQVYSSSEKFNSSHPEVFYKMLFWKYSQHSLGNPPIWRAISLKLQVEGFNLSAWGKTCTSASLPCLMHQVSLNLDRFKNVGLGHGFKFHKSWNWICGNKYVNVNGMGFQIVSCIGKVILRWNEEEI